jgi:transposase InsO family protein
VAATDRPRQAQPPRSSRATQPRPGELIHVDVKKLGRIGIRGAGHRVTGSRRGQLKVSREGRQRRATGWEFVHVCVDDATRLALDWFLERGIVAERLLSDNTWAYTKNKDLAVLLDRRQILHKRTRPYSPQTNGKVCVLASRCRPVGRRGSPRLRV